MQKHHLIQIYTKPGCPFCARAKELLSKKHVAYQEINIENNPELKKEMELRSGRHTVPQIFIGTFHAGGCDDLYALDEEGKLDALLVEALDIEKKE
jgi:glutaredoxin 3